MLWPLLCYGFVMLPWYASGVRKVRGMSLKYRGKYRHRGITAVTVNRQLFLAVGTLTFASVNLLCYGRCYVMALLCYHGMRAAYARYAVCLNTAVNTATAVLPR